MTASPGPRWGPSTAGGSEREPPIKRFRFIHVYPSPAPTPRSTPVSLVYASQRLLPLKVRAFIDFAVPRLTDRLRSIAATLEGGKPSAPPVQRPRARKAPKQKRLGGRR